MEVLKVKYIVGIYFTGDNNHYQKEAFSTPWSHKKSSYQWLGFTFLNAGKEKIKKKKRYYSLKILGKTRFDFSGLYLPGICPLAIKLLLKGMAKLEANSRAFLKFDWFVCYSVWNFKLFKKMKFDFTWLALLCGTLDQ